MYWGRVVLHLIFIKVIITSADDLLITVLFIQSVVAFLSYNHTPIFNFISSIVPPLSQEKHFLHLESTEALVVRIPQPILLVA